jgi:hypothetical protein
VPRSPIKLHCEWQIPPAEALKMVSEGKCLMVRSRHCKTLMAKARKEFRTCKWRCRAPVRAARFIERRRPDHYAIVHPSTKEPGRWQVSFFDADGPWGDTARDTCSEAVAYLRPWEYRLKEIH